MNKLSTLTYLLATALICGLGAVAPAQQTKADQRKNATETGAAGPSTGSPVFVTGNYLRMHHPEVLGALAAKIKAGGANRADLARLAGSKFADTLLLGNSPVLLKPSASTSPHVGGFHVLDLPMLSPEEYSPQKVEFDSMIPGEVESQAVNVTTPIAGTLSASVSTLPNVFNVLLIESYTGYTQNGPGGSSQIIDKTSTTGSLALLQGQQFTILMQVGSFVEGTFTASLNLRCAGSDGTSSWNASIPLTIKVSKSNEYRAVRVGQSPRPVVFPGKPFSVQMSFKPINFKVPFKAKIHSLSLYGVTAQDASVTFNSNAAVNVTIQCQCLPNAETHDTTFLGTEITADDGQATDSSTTIDIVPHQFLIRFGDISSGFNAAPLSEDPSFVMAWKGPEVLIDADGHFTCLGTITSTINPPFPASTAEAAIGHQFYVPFGIYFADDDGVKHGSYNVALGQTDWIKTNWGSIANGTFKFGAWFDAGGLYKYDWPNMVPLDKNGNFTLPGHLSNITIRRW